MEKYVWRMGIRHPKDWSHWDWSPEYDSFNACANAYAKWLSENPNRVIMFARRKVFTPDQGSK